jgi:hypothetical protein
MKKIILGLVVIGMFIGGNIVYAVPTGQVGDAPVGDVNKGSSQTITALQNPLKANSIREVIFLAVDIAIYIGTIFAVLAIIFVGFKFVAAQGNETKLKDAKTWFMWIIIGLAILISSKVMVEIVKTTLINSGVVDKSVFDTKI